MMTQNQIAYWKLEEEKRANRAAEAENVRSHMATESINLRGVEETRRHNLVGEGISVMNLEEVQRSNLEQERLKEQANKYNREVGMANIAATKLIEANKLAETQRHNAVVESYDYYKTNRESDIKQQEADTKQYQYELNREEVYGGNGTQITEQKRSNQAREALQLADTMVRGMGTIAGLMLR